MYKFMGPSVMAQSPEEPSRPNILIFVADDAGWRDFGAYGNKVIQTPNIDRLAEYGLFFEQAFLITAQCSPSRISILTGLYSHPTSAKFERMTAGSTLTTFKNENSGPIFRIDHL